MKALLTKNKGLIKLLVSLAMLALVLSMADFDKLRTTVLNIPLWTVLTVVIGYSCGQLMSSYKWYLITRAGSIQGTYPAALRAYFIGMFVNCFGLGTLGGDVTRAMLVGTKGSDKAMALASVIADRAHGMAVLALIGSVAALVFDAQISLERLSEPMLWLLWLLGPTVVIAWLAGPLMAENMLPKNSALRAKVSEAARVFSKHPKVLIPITLISLVFHLWQISLHWVMCVGLDATIPWAYLLVVIPIVNIISTLPISWNGLGVRENTYVFFLSPTLLTLEQALAFGALWILGVTIASAIGGITSVLSKS